MGLTSALACPFCSFFFKLLCLFVCLYFFPFPCVICLGFALFTSRRLLSVLILRLWRLWLLLFRRSLPRFQRLACRLPFHLKIITAPFFTNWFTAQVMPKDCAALKSLNTTNLVRSHTASKNWLPNWAQPFCAISHKLKTMDWLKTLRLTSKDSWNNWEMTINLFSKLRQKRKKQSIIFIRQIFLGKQNKQKILLWRRNRWPPHYFWLCTRRLYSY